MQLPECAHAEGRKKIFVWFTYLIHREYYKAYEIKLWTAILQRPHNCSIRKARTLWIQGTVIQQITYKAGANGRAGSLSLGLTRKHRRLMLLSEPCAVPRHKYDSGLCGSSKDTRASTHQPICTNCPLMQARTTSLSALPELMSKHKVIVIQQSNIRLLITRLEATNYYFVTLVTPASFSSHIETCPRYYSGDLTCAAAFLLLQAAPKVEHHHSGV